MLPALVFVLVALAVGTLVSYLYDDDAPLVARAGFGAVSALAVLALAGFILANFVGIAGATAVSLALAAAPLGLILRQPIRARLQSDIEALRQSVSSAIFRPSPRTTGVLAYATFLALLVWLAFERVLIVDGTGVSTGYVNNLGDLPFHMQVTASFAYGNNFPPEDPTYAGTGFAYPYMSDFLTAVLVTLGAPIDGAFLIQNVVLGLALIVIVHRLTFVLTRSELAALIAPALVLLSGGLGWVVLLDEARSSEIGLLAYLRDLPHDYTIGIAPFRWGNAITTLLVTQRSLAFGLPLALLVLIQLWRLIHAPPVALDGDGGEGSWAARLRLLSPRVLWAVIRQRPEAPAAGLLTGLLPLVHAHSFIVVMGTAFLLGLLFRQWRDRKWLPWAIYVVVALAIALPEVWWSGHNSIANAGAFFGLELGWDHGNENIAWFWLLNTGMFIPLILIGLVWPDVRARLPYGLLLFSLPFLTWFVVPNVIKLAPWVWDNIKVLIYWYVGFVPLVALMVAWLLRRRDLWSLAGACLLASMVLAGAIDVGRVISRQTIYQEFDADGIAIADRIRNETPARALILHAPTWNPPVFLTGRRSLLGYTGYIWAHGLEFAPREADIRQIYAGGPEAESLLARHRIDYVLLGPLERSWMSDANLAVNDEFFARFTEVAAAGQYRLFQIETS